MLLGLDTMTRAKGAKALAPQLGDMEDPAAQGELYDANACDYGADCRLRS